MNPDAIVWIVAILTIIIIFILCNLEVEVVSGRKVTLEYMRHKNRGCYNCKHCTEDYECIQEIEKEHYDFVRGERSLEIKRYNLNCASNVGTENCNWESK